MGGGPQGVPFDQSQGMPAMDPAAAGGAQGAGPQQPVPDAPIGLLSGMGGSGSTADMTNQDLSGLTPDGGGLNEAASSPEDDMAAQLQEALNDPNTPPDQRAAIEQQIALAARKSMLGGA